MNRSALIVSTAIVSVMSLPAAATQVKLFNIPAQSMETALSSFGKQADVQIVAARRITKGKRANVVRGTLTVQNALEQLLRGTGLTAQATGAQTYAVMSVDTSRIEPQEQAQVPQEQVTSPVATTEEPEAAASENIIVTGSRLQSPTLTAPAPVQVIDQTQLQREGFINVFDAIQMNPAFGNPGRSRTSNTGSREGAGGSQVGLRNGGDTLTLTLIEGRRSVSKELAFIPTGFVDRTEILTGGASAVYGSDAVIGVVNFIYKKKFEGVLASAQYGISARGDNQEYNVDLTLGGNFAGDRGNAMLFFGYSDQAFLSNAARSYSARSFTSLGDRQRRTATTPEQMLTAARNLFVPITLDDNFVNGAGQFNVAGSNVTIAPNGTIRAALPSEFYDGAPFGTLANPSQRFNTAARINYEIADGIDIYAEGTFARQKTGIFGAPLAHSSSSNTPILLGGSRYALDTRVIGAGGAVSIVANPFAVQSGMYARATDTNNDGLRDITFQRRANEWGNHDSELVRDAFQATIGSRGELGGNWRYDAYYAYGEATQNHIWPNLVNADRYQQALAVIPDAQGRPICADAGARAAGCVPINIFAGNNGVDPAAVAWTKAAGSRFTKQTLTDIQANIAGPLFQLWSAGPVEAVIGGEYRKETELTLHDPLYVSGRNGFETRGSSSGDTDIKEAYGEIQIPLIHNTPFIDSLTVRGAGRISKYRQLDRAYTGWNVGFEWSPVRDIRFRGTRSYAIRAPTIGDLTRPRTITFDNGSRDVCAGVTPTSTTVFSEGCRADPLVVANINANGGIFRQNAQDLGPSIQSITDPNPNLGPQFSNTTTFGVVVNPTSITALRNLVATADFYKVNVSGGIGPQNLDNAMRFCYQLRLQEFCSLITRRAAPTAGFSIGTADVYSNQIINGTGVRFLEGIDFTLSYWTGLSGIGLPESRLSVNGSWSHTTRSFTTERAGDVRRNRKAEMGSPDDPWSGSISYEDNMFGLTVSGQYVPRYYHEPNYRLNFIVAGVSPPKEEFRVPPRFYTNMQTRFKLSDQYQMFMGVRNLLDVKPIVPYSGIPGTYAVYDTIGRRFYAGVRLAMK